MECPRCGSQLTTYQLEGARAIVCEQCEYVGVPADFRPPTEEEEESWEEVLARFRGQADTRQG